MVIFEATLLYNSECGYCDLPLNEGGMSCRGARSSGSLGDLYRAGIRYLFVQSGEPMVRRDIAEVLEGLAGLELLESNVVSAGYYRDYLRTNVIWLKGGGG